MGESGSGKSTIVQLIERFYDPTSGGILINGTDLKELNFPIVEERLALTENPTQNQLLFSAKIFEADAVIIVSPEYNGSYPGMFKGFIDASDVKKCFQNKKACLVGVAEGRAGNLRGMEHLTNILNYLKINVYHNKLPISRVDTLMDAQGNLTDADTLKVIDWQLEGFLKF